MTGARFSRNEALFGAEGQKKLATTKVVIAGLGGLGSHVVQQLAYLGVTEYGLIDFDHVTESSLNRLIGALESDVVAETRKVDVGVRTVCAVTPEAVVNTHHGKVADVPAESLIAGADFVFGCLDRDIHRVELTELCARYAKPYLDMATDVIRADDGSLIFGGRVVFCDGSRCLVCLPDVLDRDQIARDRMSPEQREGDQRIYGVDRDALAGTGPAVVSVNGVVASLGTTEFMVYMTGLRQPAAQLSYRGDLGTVTRSSDRGGQGCYYCEGLWGASAEGMPANE